MGKKGDSEYLNTKKHSAPVFAVISDTGKHKSEKFSATKCFTHTLAEEIITPKVTMTAPSEKQGNVAVLSCGKMCKGYARFNCFSILIVYHYIPREEAVTVLGKLCKNILSFVLCLEI